MCGRKGHQRLLIGPSQVGDVLGFVFKAHRPVYDSTLGLRVIKKKQYDVFRLVEMPILLGVLMPTNVEGLRIRA